MCIERFKTFRLSEGLDYSEVSFRNLILVLEGLLEHKREVVLELDLCVCGSCPIFRELHLSLTGVPHVDTCGETYIGATTLANCVNFSTQIRWLPLICKNAVYNGFATSEIELCIPLTSYPEVFSKLMSVDWDIFCSCLKGPLSGFKKFFSFDRTGELLFVYNKTCKAFGLPKFHRSFRCKYQKRENLERLCDEILEHTEDIDNSEVMRLMVEISSYDEEMEGFVTLENLPVVRKAIEYEIVDDDSIDVARVEYCEALEKLKVCIDTEIESRHERGTSLGSHIKDAIHWYKEVVDKQVANPTGGLGFDGYSLYHMGVPTIIEKKAIDMATGERKKAFKFPDKKKCKNFRDACKKGKNFGVKSNKSAAIMEDWKKNVNISEKNEIHDFSKTKLTVVKNDKFPLLKDFPKIEGEEKKAASGKIIKSQEVPKKIFPIARFYNFLRAKVHSFLLTYEDSRFLTLGKGLEVKQTKRWVGEYYSSDTIFVENFWVDFSLKYGTRDGYQNLLLEFDEYLGQNFGQLDVENSCKRFFDRIVKKIKNRNKRLNLTSLKDQEKSLLGYYLLTADNAIFEYRKELKIKSGHMRSLIQSRARLKI